MINQKENFDYPSLVEDCFFEVINKVDKDYLTIYWDDFDYLMIGIVNELDIYRVVPTMEASAHLLAFFRTKASFIRQLMKIILANGRIERDQVQELFRDYTWLELYWLGRRKGS